MAFLAWGPFIVGINRTHGPEVQLDFVPTVIRESKGELEQRLGDISRRSQAEGAAGPEGWTTEDCSLRVLCCSAGGARAGFPDL